MRHQRLDLDDLAALRFGRNEDAKKQFDEQIGMYPGGNETSAALYWRARLAEEDNQPAVA